ncbi:MAG: DNA replication and repair protein RecF [Candidatus Cloacimonadota bacterium]|nr:DNA replication and repair protein RecF [Candidatus Cloacimonadota bacterium]
MEILSLKLENYRNYLDFEISFPTEGAIIYGSNGIGKTNILEAIAYNAFGKSAQNSNDTELINFSKAFFRIEAQITMKNRKHFFETAVDKNRKIIKIDRATIDRISELYRYFKVVYLAPEDIQIVAGSPAKRRNFLDQAISQHSYSYIELLRNYNRILKQRNALFKEEITLSEKHSWDRQFAQYAAQIIEARLDYLHYFEENLNSLYSYIGKDENLNLEYKYSFDLKKEGSIWQNFTNYLEDIYDQEIYYQRSLCGPHLDDIDFRINKHSARKYASQGQKRSLAVAIRLAQAQLINSKDDKPVLIFDDVLADLDKNRSQRIFELLKEQYQIFIATPNREHYQNFPLPIIDLEEIK